MIFLLLALSIIFPIFCTPEIAVSVSAQKNERLPVVLVLPTGKQTLQKISEYIKKALEFKGQLAVTIETLGHALTREYVVQKQKEGFVHVISIQEGDNCFEWRGYDVSLPQTIHTHGKRVAKRGTVLRAWAYALADSLHEALTNEPAFFSTKLAYVKKKPLKNGLHYNHIFIADYDGSNEEVLVETPTINIGPRWNNDSLRPLIFYSENTNANMRLMVSDMKKKKIVASNFDGLNMLPTFSPDGKSVIFCATRGTGSCQLYHWSNKVLKKLTNNEANNFSPHFGPEGTIVYFSADGDSKSPQIYSLHLGSGDIEKITPEGYCTSPAYCSFNKKLAYIKQVNGIMQLFTYDIQKKQHQQLTTDKAQKEECGWSPCGTYILCGVDNGITSRIALFNTISKDYTYLTNAKDHCSYPTWSGIYHEYPVIGT